MQEEKQKRQHVPGKKNQVGKHILNGQESDSLQTLELAAVTWALTRWRKENLNIVSDSLYVVGVVLQIEDALIKPPKNDRVYQLFLQVKRAIADQCETCCIIHIRSHQTNLGLGEGNARADALVSSAINIPQDSFTAARESHALFHQATKALKRQFNITIMDAQSMVKTCPQCSQHGASLGLGVNPRGLQACELQMDVTHVSEFGRFKYVHVVIDTF